MKPMVHSHRTDGHAGAGTKRTARKYYRQLSVSVRTLGRILDDYDRHEIPRDLLDELCHRISDVATVVRKMNKPHAS
jgi:hypothetical protein